MLAKAAACGPPHSGTGLRELHFAFFRKPEKFLSSVDKQDHVAGVRFEKTVLEGNYLCPISYVSFLMSPK